jgi:hypothetical protein
MNIKYSNHQFTIFQQQKHKKSLSQITRSYGTY